MKRKGDQQGGKKEEQQAEKDMENEMNVAGRPVDHHQQ